MSSKMKCGDSKYRPRTVLYLLLLCVVYAYTLQVRAQESCYEQYLREHNKKILTAEDADDSYDELKKTVLAKQMYGDSYLLMVDTVAQRAMITKADGTYIADVHVALVDSTWYMWLSVDPLADKNIANTPYMYCNGNPIMLIDPDGKDDIVINIDDGTTTVVKTSDNNDNFYLSHNGVVHTESFYHSGKNIFTITEEVSGDNVGTTFMTSSLSNAEEFFKALSIETQCYKVDEKTKETGAMFVDNIAYIMVAAQATSSIPLTSSAEKYQQYHPNAIFQILVHSHPSNGGPSGSDKSQYNKFRDVHHYIFLPALEQYVEYNDQGMIGYPINKIIP